MLENANDLRISAEALALLGAPDIGYVRALEDAGYGLFGADGTLLAECPSYEVAAALARQNGLTAFAVN
jgi:hypothetical protein